MKKIRLFLLSLVAATLMGIHTSCNVLLFESPMPQSGETISELPDFFYGTLQESNGYEYLEFERVNEAQCIAYVYSGMTKDSLDNYIARLNQEKRIAELRGSTLVITQGDKVEMEAFRVEGNMYYSQREAKYEINLAEGYFINDIDEGEKNEAVMIKDGENYLLNVKEKEHWFVLAFRPTNQGFVLKTLITTDNFQQKCNTHFRDLLEVQQLEAGDYLVHMPDEVFLNFIETPDFYEITSWERINKPQLQSTSDMTLLAFLTIVIVFTYLWLKDMEKAGRKSNDHTEEEEENYL